MLFEFVSNKQSISLEPKPFKGPRLSESTCFDSRSRHVSTVGVDMFRQKGQNSAESKIIIQFNNFGKKK